MTGSGHSPGPAPRVQGRARWLTVGGLLAVSMVLASGCTASPSHTPGADASAAGGRAADVPAAGGADSAACAAIRDAITADMTSFGKALGAVVGDTVGEDSDRRDDAAEDVGEALRKIGADIVAAGRPSTDPALRTAATQSAQRVDALASDPSLLSDVDDMDDVPAVIARLTQATSPVATACQDS